MVNYPNEEELNQIARWSYKDFYGWMDFIKGLWAFPKYFSREKDEWHLSIGGWSGNESIIDAMQNNYILWSLSWESSHRGGHYTFTTPTNHVENYPEEPK